MGASPIIWKLSAPIGVVGRLLTELDEEITSGRLGHRIAEVVTFGDMGRGARWIHDVEKQVKALRHRLKDQSRLVEGLESRVEYLENGNYEPNMVNRVDMLFERTHDLQPTLGEFNSELAGFRQRLERLEDKELEQGNETAQLVATHVRMVTETKLAALQQEVENMKIDFDPHHWMDDLIQQDGKIDRLQSQLNELKDSFGQAIYHLTNISQELAEREQAMAPVPNRAERRAMTRGKERPPFVPEPTRTTRRQRLQEQYVARVSGRGSMEKAAEQQEEDELNKIATETFALYEAAFGEEKPLGETVAETLVQVVRDTVDKKDFV